MILNAIDRLWQEHLYATDSSAGSRVSLRRYGQKDPLIEYKTEAYEMFIDLMASIKNEVLNNLFRSTSNLIAFEQFLANLPQHLLRPTEAGAATPAPPAAKPQASGAPTPEEQEMELPLKRELPKVGRNDPCPCGSGKKYKSCCGRSA